MPLLTLSLWGLSSG